VYCTVRRRLRARAARLGAMRMAVVSDIVVVARRAGRRRGVAWRVVWDC